MATFYIPAPETELGKKRDEELAEMLRLAAQEREAEDRATASQSEPPVRASNTVPNP